MLFCFLDYLFTSVFLLPLFCYYFSRRIILTIQIYPKITIKINSTSCIEISGTIIGPQLSEITFILTSTLYIIHLYQNIHINTLISSLYTQKRYIPQKKIYRLNSA